MGVFSSCSSVIISPNNDVLYKNKKLILTVSLPPFSGQDHFKQLHTLGPKGLNFPGGCLGRAKGMVASKIEPCIMLWKNHSQPLKFLMLLICKSDNSKYSKQKRACTVCCTTSVLTRWMNNSSIVSLISLCRATILYLAVDCGFWCDIHFFFLFSDI